MWYGNLQSLKQQAETERSFRSEQTSVTVITFSEDLTAAWINKLLIENNISNTKTFNAVSLYLWSSYLAFTLQVYKYVINGLGQTQIGMFDNNQSVCSFQVFVINYNLS